MNSSVFMEPINQVLPFVVLFYFPRSQLPFEEGDKHCYQVIVQ